MPKWSDKRLATLPWKTGAFYTTNTTHIYYLTALKLSKGALLIENGSATLFVDSRYTVYAEKNTPLDTMLYTHENIHKVLKKKRVFFDPTECTFAEGSVLHKEVGAQPISGKNPIVARRMQKDPQEIRAIRKSCLLLHKAYTHIRKKIRTGVREQDIAVEFEVFARKHGAQKLAFEPIIAFGPNGAMPHHRSGPTTLKKNGGVLLDLGLVVDGYSSDMTRCFFHGTVSEKLQTIYTTVKEAHAACHAQLYVGNSLRSIDQAARTVFANAGMETLYAHALGHGVGLDVHEYPIISAHRSPKEDVLCEDMVVAIEPGLYLPRVGGIRLEEMYHITRNGPKKLTV